MPALTIKDVSLRTGLSEPTLRYYEQVGLIDAVARDSSSGHRRYRESDVDDLHALACLRAMGVGIEDMRTYQANRAIGRSRSGDQRDLLLRHADRVGQQIATLEVHLDYLKAKARLWDARAEHDTTAEAAAYREVEGMLPQLAETLGRTA